MFSFNLPSDDGQSGVEVFFVPVGPGEAGDAPGNNHDLGAAEPTSNDLGEFLRRAAAEQGAVQPRLSIEIDAPADVSLEELQNHLAQHFSEFKAAEESQDHNGEEAGNEFNGTLFCGDEDSLDEWLNRILSRKTIEPGQLPDDLAKLDVEWIDVSAEEFREYERPGGEFYKITAPRWLYVSPTKNQYVVDADGLVHVIHADINRPVRRWRGDPIISWVPST